MRKKLRHRKKRTVTAYSPRGPGKTYLKGSVLKSVRRQRCKTNPLYNCLEKLVNVDLRVPTS